MNKYRSIIIKVTIILAIIILPYDINFSCNNYDFALSVYAKNSDKYEHYKEKYKNKESKKSYYKIKSLKKGNKIEKQEYRRLRELYKQYKKLSGNELRNSLTSKKYDDFKLYKKYKGYKKYKQLRNNYSDTDFDDKVLKTSNEKENISDKKCNIKFIQPLQKPFVKIQGYGETSFSGHYRGGFHNGIDFRAQGSKEVINVGDGIIEDVGDMGRYGYGRWIAVNQGCGIVTLYGHLSLIAVVIGQEVTHGDIIGMQGNTGYSTGPHLHLSVFINDSFNIVESSSVKGVFIPVGETENPDIFFKK